MYLSERYSYIADNVKCFSCNKKGYDTMSNVRLGALQQVLIFFNIYRTNYNSATYNCKIIDNCL